MSERLDFIRSATLQLWAGYASHGGLGLNPSKAIEAATEAADLLGIPPCSVAVATLAVAEAHKLAQREGRTLTQDEAHKHAHERVAMEVEREARYAGRKLVAGDAHAAATAVLGTLAAPSSPTPQAAPAPAPQPLPPPPPVPAETSGPISKRRY